MIMAALSATFTKAEHFFDGLKAPGFSSSKRKLLHHPAVCGRRSV
ncbi:hypothetical protein ART_3608 [Arthrobacter sp. PAMC 25486]|nr:hypothetical protein ART_3608 [Arthrobacter sp. PAMC 25486]